MDEQKPNEIVEPSDSGGGLNQKLDYPFLLLYQMQKITQMFSTGNISGGMFIIKLMESSCSFKKDDGWDKKIAELDKEFAPKFIRVREQKKSLRENVRNEAILEERELQTDYWIKRFDILMCLNKMRNMLYKETETGVIQ